MGACPEEGTAKRKRGAVMKRRTIKGIVAAIGIIQALSTSCEVGLGSAVDTQARE